jgi:hypothetical protein
MRSDDDKKKSKALPVTGLGGLYDCPSLLNYEFSSYLEFRTMDKVHKSDDSECKLCCLLGRVQTSKIYGKVTQLLPYTRTVKVALVMRVNSICPCLNIDCILCPVNADACRCI